MGKQFQPDDYDDWDESEYAWQPAPAPVPSGPSKGARLAPNKSTRPIVEAETIGPSVPHKRKPKNFPGFIARSALFRVSAPNEEFGSPTEVKAQGCVLILSGPKLSMRDKHVWETAIQIAKERSPRIGDAFEIELRDLAKRMGSSNFGGRALASLWDSLEKLARCRVEFQIGESCTGVGSLLATAFRENGRLYLRLNPDFAIPALSGDKQFLFDQARRSKLSSSLGQWLHDFFSTHKESRGMDLLYLRALCGYEGVPRNFPGKLRSAMQELIEVAPSLVSSFEIEETGRCSNSWKLKVVLGEEKPSFLPAQRIAAETKSGRGRVAL